MVPSSLPSSRHEPYRSRLAALRDEGVIAAVLETVGAPGPSPTWVRTYGRFEPDSSPFATLLITSGSHLFLLEAYETPPVVVVGDGSAIVPDHRVGWLAVTPFPRDRYLPTLGAVLDAGAATVVRYRPHRRCTLRVEVRGRRLYAKVFPDARGRRIDAEARSLRAAADGGELGFGVARPCRFDAVTNAVWQHEVPGLPVRDRLLQPGAHRLSCRMGEAVGSLSRSSARPSTESRASHQLAMTHRYGAALDRRIPALSPAIDELLVRVTELHERTPWREARPIHGAPHAKQWLDDGTRLHLVDFDRFAHGDPELDAATFCAEMDFEEGKPAEIAAVSDAFLAGFERASGPLRLPLLAAYRAQKRLAKSLRSARAVRPDGDERAARHLGRALDLVRQ